MGKRVGGNAITESHRIISSTPPVRSIRKRKRCVLNSASVEKALRLTNSKGGSYWHGNLDEDSSTNDSTSHQLQPSLGRNSSTKQANNSSILLNSSISTVLDVSVNESPKPVYTLRPSVVNGTVLYDLTKKPWRLGRPIGKGNFGEIFLASDNTAVPVTNENAKFVVKIEPHSNGPLFVEIHCLMNTARKNSDTDGKIVEEQSLSQSSPSGIPEYIASGSHYFGDARYRFLVLQRFDCDLHSLIKNCRVSQKHVLILAIHIVTVLQKLHDKGYVHNDVKAQNLMISKCKYYKNEDHPTSMVNDNPSGKHDRAVLKAKYKDQDDEKQQTTDSGNSSEQEPHEDDDEMDYVIKRKARISYKCNDDDDDEDFDDFDGATSQSNNSNSMDIYETPVNKNRKLRQRGVTIVEYSGSNPVRSCRRRQQANPIYEEMVKSHYLRPSKRISYSEFFNEDASSKGETGNNNHISSDDESEEFLPRNVRRTASKSTSCRTSTSVRRLTRQQEKPSVTSATHHQQQPAVSIAPSPKLVAVEEERIFLIDFGLASKFIDNGVHRPFIMDQRRAHDGTLEFTSRDAHMGAHSRRSDLECLGYNLIFWSQGYLPWKEAAEQHQQEKVHRAKEYLMTDVREMLKQIYGKQVPKFLGEFLYHVGQLAYHERPDYARYRRLFESEYQQLGYSLDNMRVDRNEITGTCVRFKEEIENKKDIFEMNKMNVLSIMNNLTMSGTPFHERTFSNRVSPKNLRSKSEKKDKKKKFSWAEILSQDPDQIARDRAEKEFDREERLSDIQQPNVRRYQGKPTYAILEVQQRMKLNGRIVHTNAKSVYEAERVNYVGDTEEGIQILQESHENIDEHNETDIKEAGEEDDANENKNKHEYDASEDSKHTPEIHCKSRRITRGFTTAAKKQKPRTLSSNRATTGRKRSAAVNSNKTTTRRSTSTLKANTTTDTSNNHCCTTRSTARKAGGIAAGVIDNAVQGVAVASVAAEELPSIKYQPKYQANCGSTVEKPIERRARRCLIKTEAEEMTGGEGSNSNFSPDVRGLFNVWRKFNNESIYLRGSNAAASAPAKHLRK